ncbi:hypothetical protein RHGRI_001064 [Rhododendron griersonianum]|uniref:Uncharacterized protein n=1 Tax=Rhododendron griersonianum TaxID=479676 RepID=A0AAV6LJR3_9ERIC|nr:hypothetical protein RHGRI_001064 [Rhododendron griersonianum]
MDPSSSRSDPFEPPEPFDPFDPQGVKQSKNGGLSAWEPAKGGAWLEGQHAVKQWETERRSSGAGGRDRDMQQ